MVTPQFFFRIASTLLISMGLASTAWAQAVNIPLIATATRGPATWTSAAYAHQFEVDVDNSSAEMSRDSVQVAMGHRAEVSDDVYLLGNFAYNGSYYDFSGASSSGLAWDDVHQATLVAGVGWKAGDNWTLVGLLLGRTAGEGGADFDETLTGGGALAIDYEWSETLSTGAIVGVLSQLEDSAGALIIPTVDWRFADDWLFHFGLVGMAYPGVGPEISWRSEGWEVAFGGSYQKRRFRLDDRSSPADEGIGEEQAFPVFVRAGYSPNENLSFAVTGGVTLGGEIRSGTESGNKLFKEDYDAAPLLGVQASYRF